MIKEISEQKANDNNICDQFQKHRIKKVLQFIGPEITDAKGVNTI
jgi:hypothetical protein